MISLTPKKRFQETEELATAFRSIVNSKPFEIGITQALAEFMLNKRPTEDQLNGVRSFIDVLLNMAEKEPVLPQFPVHHISLSPDLRRKTLTKTPTPTQSTD